MHNFSTALIQLTYFTVACDTITKTEVNMFLAHTNRHLRCEANTSKQAKQQLWYCKYAFKMKYAYYCDRLWRKLLNMLLNIYYMHVQHCVSLFIIYCSIHWNWVCNPLIECINKYIAFTINGSHMTCWMTDAFIIALVGRIRQRFLSRRKLGLCKAILYREQAILSWASSKSW